MLKTLQPVLVLICAGMWVACDGGAGSSGAGTVSGDASVAASAMTTTGLADHIRTLASDEFGGRAETGNEMIASAIADGLDPTWVGKMVRQAVIDDLPFIFTHASTRELVDARYERMKESFEWADRFREANSD